MLNFSNQAKIYVCTDVPDMRKGVNGLSEIVREAFTPAAGESWGFAKGEKTFFRGKTSCGFPQRGFRKSFCCHGL